MIDRSGEDESVTTYAARAMIADHGLAKAAMVADEVGNRLRLVGRCNHGDEWSMVALAIRKNAAETSN